MRSGFPRTPMLDRFYQLFLRDENSVRFVNSVAQHYCIGTLEKLAIQADRLTRRGAVLALGFLSDMRSNEVLGRGLNDRDRAVRMLADHGLRQIWFRAGSDGEQAELRRLARLNVRNLPAQVIDAGEQLLLQNPQLPEAWNQIAIAHYGMGDYEAAIECCQECLFLNRFHFLSAVGMGNAHLQMDNFSAALECFRLALDINPDLENIRTQIQQLEKTWGE